MKKMRWDEVIKRMPKNKAIKGVELGVYAGKMSRALLEQLPLLTLYMVDRWTRYPDAERAKSTGKMAKDDQEVFDDAFEQAKRVHRDFPGRAIIVQASTDDALVLVPKKLDFVFIDADHGYEACKNDIIKWRSHVKHKGLLCGHDYGRASHPGVTKAVDEVFPKGVKRGCNGTWLKKIT